MAYGTENGVSNNLVDYSELVDADAISEEMADECRMAADGLIDARLAGVVLPSELPLGNPPAIINNISDDLTTYFLLRRLFTGKDPNDSAWVDKFYERPLALLDKVLKDPQIVQYSAGTTVAENRIHTTTPDQDRIFSVSRTSRGGMVSDGSEGGMDEW